MRLRWYLVLIATLILSAAMFHMLGLSIETGDKETGIVSASTIALLSALVGFGIGFYLQESEKNNDDSTPGA